MDMVTDVIILEKKSIGEFEEIEIL